MDAPEHGQYRRLTNDWFKPASVRRMNDRLTEISQQALATMEAASGACDFATDPVQHAPMNARHR